MLDYFLKDPLGQVYLANAYLAYKDPDIDSEIIKKHFQKSKKKISSMLGKELTEIIKSLPHSNYAEWNDRTSKPAPKLLGDLTTTLPIQAITSITSATIKNPDKLGWLFDLDAVDEMLGGEIPMHSEPIHAEIYINVLTTEPSAIRSDAKLGLEDNPQWFTPAKEIDTLIEGVDAKDHADTIRDALGLAHYEKGTYLLQITLNKSSLEGLIDNGNIKLATPLFIDAKAHRYFRAYSDCPDYWGRTQHLIDKSHPGVKEVISSPISVPLTIKRIHSSGFVKKNADNTGANTKKHAQSLLPKGKTIAEITDELATFVES